MKKNWHNFLSEKLSELINSESMPFLNAKPSAFPELPGVYLISSLEDEVEIPFYIGRSKNLQQRLYNNHLMGPLSNARLKKYLIDAEVVKDIEEAKVLIKNSCSARWVIEEDFRVRGALEGFFTAMLFPRYGISEEH